MNNNEKRTTLDVFILVVVTSFIMIGCTRSLIGSNPPLPLSTPEPTPAPFFTTPTSLPVLPTPFPAPTSSPTPEPVDNVASDEVNDPLSCQTGTPLTGALPPQVDIGAAWVEISSEDSGTLVFVLRYPRLPDLQGLLIPGGVEFLGGVELWDPNGPAPVADEDWYFNTTGNISFNFGWNREFERIFAWKAVFNGSEWDILDAEYYPATLDENRLEIQVPLSEVPPGSQWMAVTTNFELCDAIGLEAGRPVLRLP